MRRSRPPVSAPTTSVRRYARAAFGLAAGRAATKAALAPFHASGPHLSLLFDRAELARKYLYTLRRGRQAVSDRHPWISVRTNASLGHNLEGIDAPEVLGDIAEVLRDFDKQPLAGRRDVAAQVVACRVQVGDLRRRLGRAR